MAKACLGSLLDAVVLWQQLVPRLQLEPIRPRAAQCQRVVHQGQPEAGEAIEIRHELPIERAADGELEPIELGNGDAAARRQG